MSSSFLQKEREHGYVDGNRKWKRISLITISSFGTQFLWSAEMSQASPYLLSLGISKTNLALVLMAGPLSGFFTQPIVGLYGDKCRHRLGRRRPFIIYGGISTMISLFCFAWCKDIAGLIMTNEESHRKLSAMIAVISFYILDISINIVTVSNKCLIIDVLPSIEQPIANAYGSRFSGISAILTMLISLLDLPKLFTSNTTNSTQLKIISYIGAPIFILSHLIMCLTVHEKPLTSIKKASSKVRNRWLLIEVFNKFWNVWRRSLKGSIIKSICWIQIWAGLGWFPIMFYSTVWIGEIWILQSSSTTTIIEDQHEKATRIGAIGLLFQSILALLSWLIIPRFIAQFRIRRYGTQSLDFGKTLVYLWTISQLSFGFLLVFVAPLCEFDYKLAVGLIGLTGVPWAITCWVPFTLLGEALLHKPDQLRIPLVSVLPDPELPNITEEEEEEEEVTEEETILPLLEARESSLEIPMCNEEDKKEGLIDTPKNDDSQLAGTVLGIHNVFIVIPQFIISFLSSVLFKLLGPEGSSRDQHRTSDIGIIFRVGGLATIISGLICWKLARSIHHRFLSSSSS
ncbi:hypothetical protein MJO28_015258 [Puccinia striiformis f. sp. tritici]|uniref:Uncharacterized protein n=1 Tax=Puccinia striiformis f. sp. tritici TaxID=168172 RepID=A0ACC0DUZ4_9BASI|nr:hypothetical protein MJO28_015258 [Puccinia striiformis f. sp. tritici]